MIIRSSISVALGCCLLTVLLTDACTSRQDNAGLNQTKSTDSVSVSSPKSGTLFSTLYLDSLSISGADFRAKLDTTKRQNIAFNYYFKDDTTITLYGWILLKGKSAKTDSGTYSPTYDIKLNPLGKSTVSLNADTYLSNQVLLGNMVKAISKILLKNPGATLYFIPVKKTGRISYTINIKTTGPRGDVTILSNVFQTNPSPPHQAYD